ncbi:MAG TPA: DHH family phosphoesterase, partial [Bacteroidales bacterium]|nr:DHH family phosphoesterase [Bacteroidales bacterium]
MISKIIDESLVEGLKTLVEDASSVVIIGHMGPDGDAIGSCLATMHFLRKVGKESVHVMVPNAFPDFLAWMPGADEILVYEDKTDLCNEYLRTADLVMCLDFNSLKRIGAMENAVRANSGKKALIDHHLYPEDFADLVISYPLMAASCELVFRLICRMGYAALIDLPIAECIYTGLMTDTGNFSYNSNNAELYVIISEVMRLGVDKDRIYRNVFNNYSYHRMRLMGYCLYKKMQIFPQYHTALITLSEAELEQFHYHPGDTEGIVNLPMSISGIYFSCLMREEGDKVKISLRSQGAFPTNQVAA